MNVKDLKMEKDIILNKSDALIVVDMQYDFIPGGSLAVEEGDQIIDDINKAIEIFKNNNAKIVLTQDWHPKEHLSFASNHPGKNPGDEYSSEDGAIGPVLWPDHCVQGTKGAELHKDLNTIPACVIIRKGMNPKVDSYSAFIENDKKTETGLAGYLKSLNIKRIFICGLATDYCCLATAMDGLSFGFEVIFLAELTKGVDLPPGNVSKALETMESKGIKFANLSSFKS
ncbi:MAG: bifunctional nicotinamidase/pyrazinamidase [Promethearchaeota archaeon]